MLDQQLSDEERMVRDTARQFSRDVLLPRVIDDYREERFDPVVMQQLGKLGLLGPRFLRNMVVLASVMWPMGWRHVN